MEFRKYQKEIIVEASEILIKHGLVYLAMEVRTGKTLTGLGICENIGAKSVLFVTKKKPIKDIQADALMFHPTYALHIINYESLHKVDSKLKFDTIICDEAHTMGAFPKPSKRAKQIKELVRKNGCGIILMSGTPTPESFSQMYHQVYGHPSNPFSQYRNFYAWAKDYVDVRQRKIHGNYINDYSRGIEATILGAVEPYMISFTQRQAGFNSTIKENILYVNMDIKTHKLCKLLRNNKVINGNDEVILADTGAKMMSKLHQLYSGTVIFESGKAQVLDWNKADYIAKEFYNQKIAIFYKFKAELQALKDVYPSHRLTTDLEEFRANPDMSIALQIVSGREGISLKEAEHIVYYNIDFSATSYWQSRDRMTTQMRPENEVFWIFSDGGIEENIYKTVNNKKNYTLKHFNSDLGRLF
jgi:hypothetical protein